MSNKTLSKPSASLRSWVEVTPELAGRLLGANTANYRNLSKSKVERYARDMANKKWNQHTRESLKFTGPGLKDLGRLIDGQHRLAAVMRSGETLRFMIDWEVPVEAENFLDRGYKRDVGDEIANLTQVPKRIASDAAAIAKRVDSWRNGSPDFTSGNKSLTDQDLADLVLGDLFYLEVASTISKLKVPGAPRTVLGTLYYLFAEKDAEEAEFFITSLDERADGYPRSHPIQVAKVKLTGLYKNTENKGAGRNKRIDNEDSAKIILRCWEAWRTDEEFTSRFTTPKVYRKIV